MSLLFRLLLAMASGYLLGMIGLEPLIAWRSRRSTRGDDATRIDTPDASSALKVAMIATRGFEVGKGAAAIPLLLLILGRNTGSLVLIPVACLVIGRRFPAFSRFRAGKGALPTLGVVVFGLGASVVFGQCHWSVPVTAVAAATAMYIATRTVAVPGIVSAVFLFLAAPMSRVWTVEALAIAAGSIALFGFAAERIGERGLLEFPKGREVRIWRIVARPFALLFVPINGIWGRKLLLLVIGSVALLFVVTDALRIVSRRQPERVYKSKEKNRFSSMTLFLVAAFLTFLLFPAEIAYIALACITIGDAFGKIVGIQYGRTYLYRGKTLEGSCSFFAGSLVASALLGLLFSISYPWIVVGVLVATIVELFSYTIDDNFTVTIVTGGFLAALRLFL